MNRPAMSGIRFRPEVQEQFRKAGWFPGRDVRAVFDALPGFDRMPMFAQAFLYEYGDLEVECLDPGNIGLHAILDLKALTKGYYPIPAYLAKPRSYGHGLMTFPLGDYHLDAAAVECDAEGAIYMASDFPNRMSTGFQEGIERIILEDYSDTLTWNEEGRTWY